MDVIWVLLAPGAKGGEREREKEAEYENFPLSLTSYDFMGTFSCIQVHKSNKTIAISSTKKATRMQCINCGFYGLIVLQVIHYENEMYSSAQSAPKII